MAGGALAVAPQSAQAVIPDDPATTALVDCPSDHFCLWADVDFMGDSLKVRDAINVETGENALVARTIEPALNDRATTLVNFTQKTICLYPDANFGGAEFGRALPGEYLVASAPEVNDKLSSFRPC